MTARDDYHILALLLECQEGPLDPTYRQVHQALDEIDSLRVALALSQDARRTRQ